MAATPLAPLLLRERAARGKEDRARLHERLGVASLPRPEGRLIWVHGASVGESSAALPLIDKLLDRGNTVLVTSGTVTSAAMMDARLPKGAIHQYVPLDTPRAVARFLDHWRPDAGLFIESDLWPNLILAAQARGMKLALVNARISERSAARWQRAPNMARTLLGAFDIVLAQDEEIAARFRALGAAEVANVGSLKADAPPLACDAAALAAMRSAIGTRPVLLAAQTHPGEDETILPAHDLLRAIFPIFSPSSCPRHAERGRDIDMLCGSGRRRAAPPKSPSPARPRSISPTRWASWACSIAWRLSAFWAARWCRWAGTIRWSRPRCIAPCWRARRAPIPPAPTKPCWARKASAAFAAPATSPARPGGCSPIRQAPAPRAMPRREARPRCPARWRKPSPPWRRCWARCARLNSGTRRRGGQVAGAAGRALWRQRGLQGPPRQALSRPG